MMQRIQAIRTFLLVVGTLALTGSTAHGQFPVVGALPSRAEMPDPLVMLNGRRVTSREQWFGQRRPELKSLFQYYMYGALPDAPNKIDLKVTHEDRAAFGGKAKLQEFTLSFGPAGTPPIHLLLVVPNGRTMAVPLFVGMNFCGNHALVNDPAVGIPTMWMYDKYPGVKDHRATAEGRGKQADVWAIEQSIDRGYAVATFYCGDVDPDRPDVREGIQPHIQKVAGKHDWGTIAAWAWGLSRVVDVLDRFPEIDRARIAVVGHSRLGKAAMLAGAFDERFALIIPLQAGCGGTAPSRGKVGESVKQINDHFPHWFAGAFKEFNNQPDKLPFDQNCLVALAAPRAVLFANAVQDQWANPAGQFEVLRAAEPVYRLLGAGGLAAEKMPEPGRLMASRLGYFIRPGVHSMTKGDWKVFLDYADKQMRGAVR
jgi:hypothetical protein